MPRVDYTDLDQMPSGPGRLTPGDHQVTVSKAEPTTARTGRHGLYLELTIVDGPDMDNGEPASSFPFPQRARVWYEMPGDDDKKRKALGSRLREALDAFGVYYDSSGFDTDDFVGQSAIAEIVPQADNPEYSEVKRFKAL